MEGREERGGKTESQRGQGKELGEREQDRKRQWQERSQSSVAQADNKHAPVKNKQRDSRDGI